MAGLDDVNIDSLSLDQMESLARGETAGLLPEVSPLSDPQPEPKPEPKAEPKIEPKADPGKAEPAKTEPLTADDDDEPAPADPNTATIPYQKYARERKKLTGLLKQLETKMTDQTNATVKERDEMRAKWERADERLRLLSEAMTPPAAEQVDADPEPDPAVDFLAHTAWQGRELQRVKEAVNTTQTTFQESRADQQLREAYERDVASYAANEATDWAAAYTHLLNTRHRMLQRQGYGDKEIAQIVRNEEKGLVARAVKQGKRPAIAIYEAAEDFGYRKPELAPAPASAASNGHANGNGAAAVPAAEAKPSVVEEVERIQRGMAGAKSLADVGGSAQEVSVEALAAMSEKEFAAYYQKHQKRVDALMGARQ